MNEPKSSIDKLVASLQERAKELNCLYRIEEILRDLNKPFDALFVEVIRVIPPGWQYPDVCQAKVVFENREYKSPNFVETQWVQSADIVVADQVVGTISVYYSEEMPPEDDGPFLKEETKLISTIAERLGHRIMHRRMRQVLQELNGSIASTGAPGGEWRAVVKMLKQTDLSLMQRVSRRMLNHLCWSGIAEAERLMLSLSSQRHEETDVGADWNRPMQRREIDVSADLSVAVFKIAADHIGDEETLRLVQRWIYEDRLSSLVQILNRNVPLTDIADAIRRYHHLATDESEVFSPNREGIHVSLIRRFLSDHLGYIRVARGFAEIDDFFHLLERVIFSSESHGRLGGKSAGLYLAQLILKKKSAERDILASVKVPKTWYITSDVLLHFMHHNNFDDVIEQRYKGIAQVRLEYPHIEQTFKSAHFPDDIVKGLSVALDDLGERPLIVRSSSLLEDRPEAAFSGKYKSLFLANRGSKRKRLEALMDAIAEVYASTFGPDPIDYRNERGLLDFNEEMGIMIQEVVGTQVNKYFLPTWAGVAFSRNDFRWSPQIERKDGLARLVPGLGTRAVDRLSDDYPVLLAPGRPNVRVNVSPDEILRYSPKYIDVINLEQNCFETVPVGEFLRYVGHSLPGLKDIVSVVRSGHITRPVGATFDPESEQLVVTFDNLVTQTPFVEQLRNILAALEETLGVPVDIEFAHDGRDFYLLQCRPQSYGDDDAPSPIPKDTPRESLIFSCNQFVSNGRVPDITHLVYVDPKRYEELPDSTAMYRIREAVGKLNQLLPRRRFALVGPGRWGSRGDVRLGVPVTYSDISNTAVLIEVAVQKGQYLPDLSFGTHFFQDLVESKIRYLPLYLGRDGASLNDEFLLCAPNLLAELLPDFADLSDVVRVIDVPRSAKGQVLRILQNAELDRAVGFLTPPSTQPDDAPQVKARPARSDSHWQWRLQAAKQIASQIDPQRFGVEALYVFGSTKNACAGPASDIDLLIHFAGTPEQRERLVYWLEGWSLSLAELNYEMTGYTSEGLLDVHIVTDEDIEKKNSYAIKINAPTDPARRLPIKGQSNGSDQHS